MAGHLYVLVTVIDTEKSDIAGPHYVKDAENTGIWDISLEENKIQKIPSDFFYNIYIFNGKLYGINENIFSWEIVEIQDL